ncbi:LOW QUALITY PROTEIN: translation initiation factor IF-2, mitochondrial-like [Scylla paramamosain]|uniref:LOW QUALITY PROTEIN: translation initiation factor IF-2, mitochondrial-like n=1 Tax=Scylla paramamosain TaxID=85552 RepID=UPI003083449B
MLSRSLVVGRWLAQREIRPLWQALQGVERPALLGTRYRVLGAAPCLLCGQLPRTAFHTSAALSKRRKDKDAKNAIQLNPKAMKLEKPKARVVSIWKNMTVLELSKAIERDIDTVFEIFLYVDGSDHYDEPNAPITNLRVAQETVKRAGLRFKIEGSPVKVEQETKNKDAFRRSPAEEEKLVRRPPVVTIMGHVDHGKTTLLDSLRDTCVVQSEHGGITQHIGAFSVQLESGEQATFLDTPGHAAFGAMRARGAMVTDVVVLVVAADDGVMAQTQESLKLAQEAHVPIVVAINKVDKPEADVAGTRKMLLNAGLQLEEQGGEVQAVEVSALTGHNLDQLVEAVVTQAELLNLRSDPTGAVEGVVVESRTDPGRGKVATCVIQRGTLSRGAVLVAGTAWGKVRSMFNDAGKPIMSAPPATPVQVIGWRQLPSAGDVVLEVEGEHRAAEVVEWREAVLKKQQQEDDATAIEEKLQEHLKQYRAQREEKRKMGVRYKLRKRGPRPKENVEEDGPPKVSLVLKGDVDGSVEALLDTFDTYHGTECHLDLISYGVGPVTPSDVNMASMFSGIIYTFNVEVPKEVRTLALKKGVTISEHTVIYHLIDHLKERISAQLPIKEEEEVLGEANVLEEFLITEGRKKVPIAGCRCVKGSLKKNALYRVVRGQETVHEGELSSMRHLKEEVESITRGKECGLCFADHDLRFQSGDTLICYRIKQVPQTTDWDPGF